MSWRGVEWHRPIRDHRDDGRPVPRPFAVTSAPLPSTLPVVSSFPPDAWNPAEAGRAPTGRDQASGYGVRVTGTCRAPRISGDCRRARWPSFGLAPAESG